SLSSVDHPSKFSIYIFFFFYGTAPPEIYTLSLHDALPIWLRQRADPRHRPGRRPALRPDRADRRPGLWRPGVAGCAALRPQHPRSEEHTSELQSRENLVCRLLLEKKKKHNEKGTNTEK